MTNRDATEKVRLMRAETTRAVESIVPAVAQLQKTATAGAKAARDLRYEARSSRRESHQRITPVPMPAVRPDTDTVPGPEVAEDEKDDQK